MSEPLCYMDTDGRHARFAHDCPNAAALIADRLFGGSHPRVTDSMLPLGPWIVVTVAPLTISPSIRCDECGTHGFWRNGRWEPAGDGLTSKEDGE